MISLYTFVRAMMDRFAVSEEGQTAVEYALVLALVALVLVGALATGLGDALDTVITDITSKL
jgi:Flp pilus assembly pilin Flp